MTELDRRLINLAGKDYFTTDEAAFYACVSRSQFYEHAGLYGIKPFPFMGKKLYRRIDIQNAMEQAWRRVYGSSGYNWQRTRGRGPQNG